MNLIQLNVLPTISGTHGLARHIIDLPHNSTLAGICVVKNVLETRVSILKLLIAVFSFKNVNIFTAEAQRAQRSISRNRRYTQINADKALLNLRLSASICGHFYLKLQDKF